MKRIIILAGYTPSLLRFRFHLIRDLVSLGEEVIACAPQYHQETIKELHKIGVQFKQIKLNVTGLNPFVDMVSFFQLVILFRKLKPDILFAYTIKPVLYGSLAGGLLKTPKIYSMITGLGFAFGKDSLKQRIIGKIGNLLYKIALKFNDVVFFQNPDDYTEFKINGLLAQDTNSKIINGSGVDLDYYGLEPNNIKNGNTFLMIARLLKDKGIVEYVEAARKIRKEFPKTKFNLLGYFYDSPNGITRSQINSWVEEGVINYLGEAGDVRPFIKECTVYVLPSYREGTPRSVLEAMAIGRPIITTDVPGCRETVIEGENGFLVKARNVDSLAEAMLRLCFNDDLIIKMGLKSRQIAEEKYDVHKVNRSILQAMRLT